MKKPRVENYEKKNGLVIPELIMENQKLVLVNILIIN
jgi:hypothetical protein